ncbi:MAG: DinB family protein [Candidatus Pseudobacter hemicellulosilyticus]|uniref:DinB family protein n=1 Tax=Candidatus Pseudobacter hemicellulosilyticus TaxID=3121375 RepID=A0AAJ6BF89_9BACT|nr:MAG: DinB family protein [Pseudobacter sp.]
MITPTLIQLFDQGLDKLAAEINQYPDDASLWTLQEGISNTGGNLCLHLTGSLQHFLGAVLNDSGYVRNRDAEFSLKNITRKKLLDEVEAARIAVKDTLEQLSKKQLEKEYPIQVYGEPMTTQFFMFQLINHFHYHLGQINYHRRLLGKATAPAEGAENGEGEKVELVAKVERTRPERVAK